MTISDALENLSYLIEEGDFSKRAQEKATKVISILESKEDLAVEKALLELENMGTDLSSYHRTQVWEIISILESVNV